VSEESGDIPKIPGYGGLLGSIKHDLIYMNLPKSGCTTIKNYLYYLDNGSFYSRPLHIHFDHSAHVRADRQPIELLAKLTRRAKVFTFIREPILRVYSSYNEKIHSLSRYSFGDIRFYLVDNYGLSFPASGKISLDNHISNFLLFLNFLADNFAGSTPIRQDYHWLAQHRVLKQHSKKIVIDFIGIVETFERDFSELLFSAGVPNSLPFDRRFNEGPASLYSLKEVMNSEIAGRLHDLYATDIEFYALRKSIPRDQQCAIP
jgi:Sulfotransferase family